ncbi:hypothetical protein ISN44_As08g026590 [Arabidopsis suecica]|uniref:SCRp n=1 Tax=Arabidopsis suecica TaxID=45249 RepID=A0A8T2B8S4_ARASU|nr:hypothetical protein ISN44_As08g026590 [Arabidopsis suecica]
MRSVTSSILLCLLMFLVTNNVKGREVRRNCPYKLMNPGKCGANKVQFCLDEFKRTTYFPENQKNGSRCRPCKDTRVGNQDVYSCVCLGGRPNPC